MLHVKCLWSKIFVKFKKSVANEAQLEQFSSSFANRNSNRSSNSTFKELWVLLGWIDYVECFVACRVFKLCGLKLHKLTAASIADLFTSTFVWCMWKQQNEKVNSEKPQSNNYFRIGSMVAMRYIGLMWLVLTYINYVSLHMHMNTCICM